MKILKYIWLFIYIIILIWSGFKPKDTFTWFLEVFPALVGFVVLCFTYNTFRLTPLLYILILIHSVILMIGGHYTYAEVPILDLISNVFGENRNNYDKIGHLAQGFIPAIITREILIGKKIIQVINSYSWLNFIIICICLALSAAYELIEWFVALKTGESADEFLGTQGYIWDTQSDMLMALIGAIISLILLSKLHNNQINKL